MPVNDTGGGIRMGTAEHNSNVLDTRVVVYKHYR